jgi:hypothetical protein
MKRDMDLVRKIALAIEEHPSGFAPNNLTVEGYSHDQIGYHVILMMDAGLVNGIKLTHMRSTSPEATATSLTWAGHEFVDAARSDTVWNKATAVIRDKVGTASIAMLIEVLKQQAKQMLGLP